MLFCTLKKFLNNLMFYIEKQKHSQINVCCQSGVGSLSQRKLMSADGFMKKSNTSTSTDKMQFGIRAIYNPRVKTHLRTAKKKFHTQKLM